MKVIKATAGYIHHEADGPARLIVADVYGGMATLVISDHPEDDEVEMRRAAKLILSNRQGKRKE